MKKLRISQIFSRLVAAKLSGTDSVYAHNLITKFVNILDIIKEFDGNHVNEHGHILLPGVVPGNSIFLFLTILNKKL